MTAAAHTIVHAIAPAPTGGCPSSPAAPGSRQYALSRPATTPAMWAGKEASGTHRCVCSVAASACADVRQSGPASAAADAPNP
jgi:hypothetical protein